MAATTLSSTVAQVLAAAAIFAYSPKARVSLVGHDPPSVVSDPRPSA